MLMKRLGAIALSTLLTTNGLFASGYTLMGTEQGQGSWGTATVPNPTPCRIKYIPIGTEEARGFGFNVFHNAFMGSEGQIQFSVPAELVGNVIPTITFLFDGERGFEFSEPSYEEHVMDPQIKIMTIPSWNRAELTEFLDLLARSNEMQILRVWNPNGRAFGLVHKLPLKGTGKLVDEMKASCF